MSLFDWLLIVHLLGDFVFQTKSQAINKSQGKLFNWALVSHSLVYTLLFLPLVLLGKFHWAFLLILFASHVILDYRVFTLWWIKKIKGLEEEKPAWLVIMVDQALHLIVLAIIASL